MSLIDRKQNIRHNSYFEAYPLMKLFPVALHWLKAKRSAGLAASLQALVSVFIMGVLLLAGAPTRADTVTYIHSDFSGSPLAATDESGNLLWKESYYAYGQKTQWQPAADEQSQWFHGKEQDADTGMQYFGARYYDPSIGRFLGIDPVDYKDGNLHSFNRYAYGNNNPIKFRDPDGAYAEAAFEAISLAVGLDSLGKNYVAGNYGAATVDAAGLVLDAALTAVPLAPGMVGLGIKAMRESGEAAAKGMRWQLGPNDLDFRGTGKGLQDALNTAFEKTGLPKSDFAVTKWGKDANGKSFPSEWRHSSGAEVNVDWAHAKNGPDVPHVGFQTGGKRGGGGATRGHILLDNVPFNR